MISAVSIQENNREYQRIRFATTVSIDLHRASPTTGPTLTRVLIGDAPAQDEAGGPPSRSPIKWRWGLEAVTKRLAAATVPTILNPNPI